MSLVAGSVSVNLESQVDKLLAGFAQASKAVDNFESKSKSSASNAGSSFINLGNIVSSAIGNTVANAFSSATTAMGNFYSSQLAGAGNLESTRIAFDGLIGDATKAGDIMGQVVKAAAKTPFEIPELADSAKMLAGFGVEADKIIPSLMSVGDVASGLNVPIKDMAYLVGTIQSSGKAMTVDLNQFAQRGVPIWKALEKVTGKSRDALGDMASNGEITSDIINRAFQSMSGSGGAFYQMMERKSDTFQGMMSTMSDTIGGVGRQLLGVTDTGEIIAGGLFEKLKGGLQGTINFLTSPAGTTFIGSVSDQIKKAIDFLGNLKDSFLTVYDILVNGTFDSLSSGRIFGLDEDSKVHAFLFTTRDILVEIKNIIQNIDWGLVTKSLQDWSPLILGVLAGFTSFQAISAVTTTITGISTALTVAGGAAGIFAGALAFLTSPILLVAVGIGSLVALGVLLYQNWDFVSQFLVSSWNYVSSAMSVAFNNVFSSVTSTFENIKNTIFGVIKSITDWLFVSFDVWVYRAFFVFGFIVGNILKFGLQVFQFIDYIGASIAQLLINISLSIGNFFDAIPGFLGNLANGIGSSMLSISSAIGRFFESLPGLAAWVAGQVGNLFNQITGWLSSINLFEVGKNIVFGLWNGLKSAWQFLSNWFRNATAGLVDGFKKAMGIHSPSRVMAELGVNVSQGLVVGLEENQPKLDLANQSMALSSVAPVENRIKDTSSDDNQSNSSSGTNITINVPVGSFVNAQSLDDFFKIARNSAKKQGFQIA
jgi:tape measure domain-containing protein